MTGKPASWGPSEMTTEQAAAYLAEYLPLRVDARMVYLMRGSLGQRVAEKRGRRLVFTKAGLDAFLAEFGTDPSRWLAGRSQKHIADLRARGINDPAIEALMRSTDPDPDGWNPADAAR